MDSSYAEVLKIGLRDTISKLEHNTSDEEAILRKRLTEFQTKMDNLDEKFALGSALSEDVYLKMKSKLNDEISSINEGLSKMENKISNQKTKVDSCVEFSQNIANIWNKGTIEVKVKLQNMVFPEGVVINPTNKTYRTKSLNSVIAVSKELSKKKRG